jgi:hypothetical protein
VGERAEALVARGWRRAQRRALETEGFLEDALVAALEDTAVWRQLVAHLGWAERVPAATPRITTQQVIPGGRFDIRLDWDGHTPLVLELKAGDPPGAAQVEHYLRHGVRVAAIARTPVGPSIDLTLRDWFLGVVTWRQVRELRMPDAPLALRQLHRLLDATEVAMPRIDERTLGAVAASWHAWGLLDAWSRRGIAAVRDVFAASGVVLQLSKTVEDNHGRYAYWLAATANEDHTLWVGAGLYVGDELDPPQEAGYPDLILAVDVPPTGPYGQRLRHDAALAAAAQGWADEALAGGTAVLRLDRVGEVTWQPLVARGPGRLVLEAPDQEGAFVGWLTAEATAWVRHGLIQRLAELVPER